MAKKNKRKTVLVDPSVQWAIVRQAVIHWLAFTLAAMTLLALQFLALGLFTPSHEQWPTICRVVAAMFLSLMLLLPLFVLDSFQLSNRFVGPVKLLRRALRGLAEGKPYSRVAFRKGDFWQEMADELNRAVETLREQRSVEDSVGLGQNGESRSKELETVA
jgi:hypothetical protein